MKALIVAVISLTLCACGPSHHSTKAGKNDSSQDKAASSNGTASITADPNPVPPGAELGTTTITWDTGTGKGGEVYVSENSGPEKRFAAGASGSHDVKWIGAGKRYDFRLYQGSEHSKVLAEVLVTHPRKPAH
jgi:hypothetical protein